MGRTFSEPKERERLFALQRKIAYKVVLEDRYSEDAVAGVDQAFLEREGAELVISGAVALDSSLHLLDRAHSILETDFPYVPGLLSFREAPSAIEAVMHLGIRPTILFVDGCGINHPRRAGLASHIGVTLDIPTVGVSKNPLCGTFDPPSRVGEATALVHEGEHVGYVLLSKNRCRPIVVAPGHMVSVESALKLARRYLRHHKLPEPCQMAHEFANQVKRRMADRQTAHPSD